MGLKAWSTGLQRPELSLLLGKKAAQQFGCGGTVARTPDPCLDGNSHELPWPAAHPRGRDRFPLPARLPASPADAAARSVVPFRNAEFHPFRCILDVYNNPFDHL